MPDTTVHLSTDRKPTSELSGLWRNTSPTGLALAGLSLQSKGSSIAVVSYPTHQPMQSVAWSLPCHLYYGIKTTIPIAFIASRRFGSDYGILQGNLNQGLLVLCAYKRGSTDNLYSREFFCRDVNEKFCDDTIADSDTGHLFAGIKTMQPTSYEPFLGCWHNSDNQNQGISKIDICDSAYGPKVRVADKDHDVVNIWFDALVRVYAGIDEAGLASVSLLASYTAAGCHNDLQLRVVGGTLASCKFKRYTQKQVKNHFTREFFFLP